MGQCTRWQVAVHEVELNRNREGEVEKERTEGVQNAHTNIHEKLKSIGRLYQGRRRSAFRVSTFKSLLESSIAPQLPD